MRLLGPLTIYLFLGLLFLAIIGAGFALSVDLAQFRYAVL